MVYGLGARCYHIFHDLRKPYRPPVPVISVGNLTVGGTGKTPTVIALTQLVWKLRPEWGELNRVAILTRGYGRRSRELVVVSAGSAWEECGDEPILIKRSLPDAAVVVHPDRVKSARYAVEQLGARCLILDDGFQHRRLARDLDLVLMDGDHPVGNGRMIPAGPLREPAANVRRASLIIGVGDTFEAARKLATSVGKPFASVAPVMTLPQMLLDGRKHKVTALTSIARPQRFINYLINNRIEIISIAVYPDHHRFKVSDLSSTAAKAHAAGAEAILTTEKDLVRIPHWTSPIPLLAVKMYMHIRDEVLLSEFLVNTALKT